MLLTLIQQFPEMRLETDALKWGDHTILRGLKALPIRLSGSNPSGFSQKAG